MQYRNSRKTAREIGRELELPGGLAVGTIGLMVLISAMNHVQIGDGTLFAHGVQLTDDRDVQPLLGEQNFDVAPASGSRDGRIEQRLGKKAASEGERPNCRLVRAVAAAEHPRVSQVYYPGLDSHPQHALARRQAAGRAAPGRQRGRELLQPPQPRDLLDHRRSRAAHQGAGCLHADRRRPLTLKRHNKTPRY